MKITFCGAAKIVTGSCYLIEVGSTKFLVDCGMFQGPKEVMKLNYNEFLFDPKEIDFMLLTHAHIDHSGLIPKLSKFGFTGNIYATSATIDLTEILLSDSAHIQEETVKNDNKRRQRIGLELRQPLYTEKDVARCTPLFKKAPYKELLKINDSIFVRYQDAGHIMGSAIIEIFVTEGDKKTKVVFSGDLGQRDTPIVQNPTLIEDADYLFIESTYGDRLHKDVGTKEDLLEQHVRETFEKGGKLIIPSFAVERTQELLYYFNKLIRKGKFPNERIFLDSPLAIKATEIFKRHTELFDNEALTEYKNPFEADELEYLSSIDDSRKLNDYAGPCIIIAGNGMCTAGRIMHHIKHCIWNSRNTLMFVGYQAEGTLGREILEGAKVINLMGMDINVNAEICKINSFSGHADANQLLRRAKGFVKAPKKTFIVHGEGNGQLALKGSLEGIQFDCYIPSLGETIEV